MDVRRILLAIALPLVSSGCAEIMARLHGEASLVENAGRLAVGNGANVVLEYEKEFFLLPVGDAYSSKGFYIELEASRLVEGSVLAVPSDIVRCFQWRTDGPTGKTAEDCVGSVSIASVSREQVRARVDVRSGALGLNYHQRVKFVTAPERASKSDH
jgi:hypothetical protein